jgi:hypothetical protein
MRRRSSLIALSGAFLLMSLALSAAVVHADRGVGVNLGRIEISDRLAPGGGYDLPTLGVINTGDEPSEYEVVMSYFEDQQETRPPAGWFNLQPQRFFLNKGEVQNVKIRLTLPTGADAGDYFALIEAHPVAEGDGVTIGLAAATAVSFNVKPSSWLEALRVRFDRLMDDTQPWSSVIPISVLAALLVFAVNRSFRFRVERR